MSKIFSLISIVIAFFTLCKPCIADKYGSLTPDQIVEVGSPLEITCTLSSNILKINGKDYHVNASYLTIKKTNVTNSSPVDSSTVHIISPLALSWRVNSTTDEDTGTYACTVYAGNEDNLIGLSEVYIGRKPQNSSIDFRCISNYEVLNCIWKTEPSVLSTNSTLKDVSRLNFNNKIIRETPCPKMIKDKNNTWQCRWTEEIYPPFNFRRKKFEFRVETTNQFGTKSDSYFISHYEIVRPKKPRKVNVLSRNSNMIELSWFRPAHMEDFSENLSYQIICMPQMRPKSEVFENTINRSDLEISYKIADLIPNTVYDIVLRCRSPYASGEDMWSDNYTIIIRTLPDAPFLPPNTTKEAFEVIKSKQYRTIIIQWENLSKEKWNGEDFHYNVSVDRIHNGRKEHIYDLKFNVTYANFDNLDLDSAYHFKIYSANRHGSSKSYSSIIVDSDEELLDVPENIMVIEYSHKKYNISWKPSNRHSATIKSYTLFWCDRPRSYIRYCEGSLHWEHVTGTSKSLIITDEGGDFQFAVAANSGYSTSGMAWAPCIVPPNSKPSKPDLKFCCETPTSLFASLKLKCRAEKALIKESYILYCKVASKDDDCGGAEIVKKLPDGAESYNITDLAPFTWYASYFMVFTHDNKSVVGDIRHQQTLSAEPSDPPSNVKSFDVTNSSIGISWEAPKHPNGIITSYWLKCNESYYPINSNSDSNKVVLKENIMPFTNYAIQLSACVDGKCSPYSEQLLVKTKVGIPGEMSKPEVEVNASSANIQWHPPLNPNGPIDYYILYVKRIEGYNESYNKIINMTGDTTSRVVDVDCPIIEKGIRYSFQLQPVNSYNNTHLFGQKTEPIGRVMCRLKSDEGLPLEMTVSIIVGSAVGCAILLIISYMFIRWMKKKYNLLKTIKVRLPKGLDTPNRCAPGTYEEFEKEFLQRCPNPVQRQGSFSSDSIKNRHGSGNSQYSNYSTDELLMRRSNHCRVFCRNPSADSSSGCSSTGHDSIVSCCTNQTHVSADSGAETDLSPVSMKDNVFLQEESQQEPTIFILPDVKEKSSDDNKLTSEKGHELEKSHKVEAYPNIPSLSSAYIHPYSKFGVNQIKDGKCHNYSRQHSILPYVRNLANSEPSVAEIDFSNANDYDGSSLIPYSKLTFSKSLENISGNNIGYSKCGIIDSNTVCDVPNIIKLTDFNTNKHRNDAETGNTSKPYYVGVRKCLEDGGNTSKPQVPPLTENADATSSDNSVDSMAYSKFDINPSGLLSLDSRINTKATAYIPLQKAMLQAMDIPCSPLNDAMDKDLSCNNISLPAEIVVSAIIDPHVEQCAVNASYVPLSHHNNICFCTNHVGNQDITPVSLDYNRTDEKPITSLSDVNLNKGIRLGTNENQTSADEQTLLKSYLKESEVVVSPGSLNYSATLVPEYRFRDQSNMEPVNSKNGYINFSPVYYV